MAKTNAERSAKAAKKRKENGEEELRLGVRQGTKAALAELMARHGIKYQAEAMTLMIHNLHAMPPEQSAAALSVPQHKYRISENVAREFHNESLRELRRDPGDEVVTPTTE